MRVTVHWYRKRAWWPLCGIATAFVDRYHPTDRHQWQDCFVIIKSGCSSNENHYNDHHKDSTAVYILNANYCCICFTGVQEFRQVDGVVKAVTSWQTIQSKSPQAQPIVADAVSAETDEDTQLVEGFTRLFAVFIFLFSSAWLYSIWRTAWWRVRVRI